MSEMIERVALAIERARARGEAYGGRKLARIAIKAMRGPTEAMTRAGIDGAVPHLTYNGDDGMLVKAVWRAMIDAALSETSE